MYWAGEMDGLGEGHISSGVTATALRWGLAEGRVGSALAYDTYILLANPSTSSAEVTVTYLRENGVPIVMTYTVPATSRFNIDVKTMVPELIDASFGARIDVTTTCRLGWSARCIGTPSARSGRAERTRSAHRFRSCVKNQTLTLACRTQKGPLPFREAALHSAN